jgi:hypothetical protein
MEMDDVVTIATQHRAKPQTRRRIEGISNLQRLTRNSSLVGPPPQLPVRVTYQFSDMTGPQQFKGKARDLGLTAAEIPFRIYSSYPHAGPIRELLARISARR